MKKIVEKLAYYLIVALSGIGLYCYANFQFWTHFNTDYFEVLQSFNSTNIYGYKGRQILIHKNFKDEMILINKYAAMHNVDIVVFQGFRSSHYVVKNAIVKPAKNSNHLAGFAIDFNIRYQGKNFGSKKLKNFSQLPNSVQNFLKNIRKDEKLRWGGDFSTPDSIHIDSPLNIKNENLWNIYYANSQIDYLKRVPLWEFWL